MVKGWKLSTFNGALIAAYVIPSWAIPSIKIAISPVHGLYYERANVAVALFVSDHLQLSTLSTVRYAWLLAIAKLTVVAFFALFVGFLAWAKTRHRGETLEALAIALTLGSAVSFISMMMAARVGEFAALRLHATELLLMVSIGIVMLFETAPPVTETAAVEKAPAVESMPSGQLSLT